MNTLLRTIRYIVITFNLLIAVVVLLLIKTTIPSGSLQTIRLTQTYALLAISYLYISLIISPLHSLFPNLYINRFLIRARRATGVSAFMFALIHACFAFFGQLGGFKGLGFLSNTYLLAITLSFTALTILACMAATSFDRIIAKIGFQKWKLLHRFVYLAGILIVIHALLLGTHFSTTSGIIYRIASVALVVLLLLEALRLDTYMKRRFELLPQFGGFFVLAMMGIMFGFFSQQPTNGDILFNIHAQHLQLAKDLANGTSPNIDPMNKQSFPGMQGDRTKRYTVSIHQEETIVPMKDTTLNFQIYDASSGDRVFLFSKINEKLLHLVVVDNKLVFFNHIHPIYDQNGFKIVTQFPHPGMYHLYLDFQPLGAIEQQFAFTVLVGNSNDYDRPTPVVDQHLTKSFGAYTVALQIPNTLNAFDLAQAKQTLSFTLYNTHTNSLITTLKPYLEAYGHLVMINTDTFEYIHVHPANLTPPAPDANGGPTVNFIPMSLYTQIKPGTYRVFAQFNPNNHLFTSDFTIKIE